MAYTKAGNKAVQKYISKSYDQFSVRVPKGDREKYKSHAESKGMSLNALIVKLLEDDIAATTNFIRQSEHKTSTGENI